MSVASPSILTRSTRIRAWGILRKMAQTTDIARAYKALDDKAKPYATRWAYYDGRQPLRYANPDLTTKFAKLVEHYTANWCAVVVDSLLDRLDLSGLSHEDDANANALSEMWRAKQLDLEAEEVHRSVAVCGEGFLIVDLDDAEQETFVAQPPELCELFYDAADPRRKEFAAKWWVDERDERRYLNLYYPDRVEYWVSTNKAENVSSANSFVAAEEGQVANPFAPVIPVFHWMSDRRGARGELQNVVDLQDAFNKLLADMMMASEYGAFKQRFVISNADTAALKNAPDELWEIPAGEPGEQPTQVGQFEATELANFTGAMDVIANKLAVVTRTPKHYLLQTGGEPSGEALIAMEAPLIKKVRSYQRRFDPPWREVAEFMLARHGVDVPRATVDVTWGDPRTVQPLAEGQARKLAIEAGIPLALWLQKHEGWSGDDLVELEQAQQVEADKTTMTAGEAMYRALRESNANPQGVTTGGNGDATPAMSEGG